MIFWIDDEEHYAKIGFINPGSKVANLAPKESGKILATEKTTSLQEVAPWFQEI